MNVDDFFFELPEELIAAFPAERRDQSRLLVVPEDENAPNQHRVFSDVVDYLRHGDVLVVNNSRVIPARLYARRPAGGGQTEILLLTLLPGDDLQRRWRALVKPGRKARVGDRFVLEDGRTEVEVTGTEVTGERELFFHANESFLKILNRLGRMPLPPYILKRRERGESAVGGLPEEELEALDRERYQTVYARDAGSVAAPTAGLHFTPELLNKVRAMGVEVQEVTLHVGAGTFVGMEAGTEVEKHQMHSEFFLIPADTAEAVNRAKEEGRRVVAVGTTSVRTMEAACDASGKLKAGPGETDLKIAPGYQWKLLDVLITNFHLPRSTLLLLVSALIGRERLLATYAEAIEHRYRFFSYGDAMLLHRPQT